MAIQTLRKTKKTAKPTIKKSAKAVSKSVSKSISKSVSKTLSKTLSKTATSSGDRWSLKGELVLNCNCTVFCPCVASLGLHPPTEGYCQTWAGARIDKGRFGKTDLSGRRIGLIMEIPGLMSRGNWSVGLFVDDEADDAQAEALEKIFTGKAGGTSSLLSILTGTYLGMHRVPISYETEGGVRTFSAGRAIHGEVSPVSAAGGKGETKIVNSPYWIASEIVISRATKSRVKAFGRLWNFAGRSAEICPLSWSGP